jgi:tRNA nucleotidyltransferase (CCA-adding enzyme)
MQASLDTLKKVSKERVQDELCKTLMSANPSYGIWLLWWSGALQIVSPILPKDFIVPSIHKCNDLETKLALLYYNHPIEDVKRELINLKFANKEMKMIIFLLELMGEYWTESEDSVRTYKSFIAHIKNKAPCLWSYALEQFITLSEAAGMPCRAQLDKYKDVVVLSRKEMNINGDDLMATGIKPGPQIKTILDKCYAEVLDKPEHNTKEYLLGFMKNLSLS